MAPPRHRYSRSIRRRSLIEKRGTPIRWLPPFAALHRRDRSCFPLRAARRGLQPPEPARGGRGRTPQTPAESCHSPTGVMCSARPCGDDQQPDTVPTAAPGAFTHFASGSNAKASGPHWGPTATRRWATASTTFDPASWMATPPSAAARSARRSSGWAWWRTRRRAQRTTTITAIRRRGSTWSAVTPCSSTTTAYRRYGSPPALATSSSSPLQPAKDMAGDIVTSQSAESTRMNRLLGKS